MDAVVRALAIYFFLLLIMRLAGRRTFGEMTPFDFVLLLVIGESTQQALIGDDFSFANAAVLITTLVGIDVVLSIIKQRSRSLERLMDGLPLILVRDGQPIKERMDKARVDEEDILASARMLRGLERLDQIKYAVLETDGNISIIPREPSGSHA